MPPPLQLPSKYVSCLPGSGLLLLGCYRVTQGHTVARSHPEYRVHPVSCGCAPVRVNRFVSLRSLNRILIALTTSSDGRVCVGDAWTAFQPNPEWAIHQWPRACRLCVRYMLPRASSAFRGVLWEAPLARKTVQGRYCVSATRPHASSPFGPFIR